MQKVRKLSPLQEAEVVPLAGNPPLGLVTFGRGARLGSGATTQSGVRCGPCSIDIPWTEVAGRRCSAPNRLQERATDSSESCSTFHVWIRHGANGGVGRQNALHRGISLEIRPATL